MTRFTVTSDAGKVADEFARDRAAIDPAIQSDMRPLMEETVRVERQFTPKGRRSLGAAVVGGSRGSGKSLADSITGKVGRLGFGTRTAKRYALIINSGGSTGPHVIVPRSSAAGGGKKALAYGGVVYKRVNHPGGHYRGEHYAEKTVAVMEPKFVAKVSQTVGQVFE